MADKDSSFASNGDGGKTVTTAGTAVQLSSTSILCRKVLVQARQENTQAVVVGGSTVVAAASTRRGIALVPGESQYFPIKDVSQLWLDSLANSEGVSFIYFA